MNRRSLLTGLIGVLAAPAVVRAEGLMKIAAPRVITVQQGLVRGGAISRADLLRLLLPGLQELFQLDRGAFL